MRKHIRYLALFLLMLMLIVIPSSCRHEASDDDAYTESDAAYKDGENGASEDKSENRDDDSSDGDLSPKNDVPQGGSDGNNAAQNGSSGPSGQDKKGYIEDENGIVVTARPDISYNSDYIIINDKNVDYKSIPEEEQGLEKSERRATEASKYDFDNNPIINRDRQQNKSCLPSFNIDDTGFVREGTRLSNLRGKTLAFFTADNFAAWSYRDEKGRTIDEWEWFNQLKRELGLNIKYTVKQHNQSTQAALTAMNSGAACDIVYSNHVVFPSALCISRSLTNLININNLGSSPGVCKKTMDLCKWGNTLRLVSPIGCVDVLWYNETLAQQLGLPDPHIMWENGMWDWNSFKRFLNSAPAALSDGSPLCAFVEWTHNASYIWPSTNGCVYMQIDSENYVPAILNAWDNPKTIEAWEFITTVHNSVSFGCDENGDGSEEAHLGLYEGTTLMSATMYTQVYRDTEYSKNIRINWVPYPKSPNECGQEICQFYGFGMMLPKKTANENNVYAALKFMELWATRFTESLFDNLNTFEYHRFNYKERKQYFDFVTQNVVFGLAMNDFEGSQVYTRTNFFEAFCGTGEYNVKTEAAKASNFILSYVEDCMKFGE